MNKLNVFFGWLFLTQSYLDTLSDEEVAVRAGITSNRWGYLREHSDRLIAKAYKAMRSINLKGL